MRPSPASITVALVLLVPELAAAQDRLAARPWTFLTRLVATGSSDHSEPAGYKVYSSFALDAGLRRHLSRTLAAELRLRTESREVDSLVPSGEDRRLGSLELLPVDLMLQLRPFTHGSVRPYAGGGVNLTVAWEKSGVLDSTDMAGSVGPSIEAGLDIDLASYMLLNFNLQWNSLTAKLANGGIRLADLQIDPLTLGVGVGFEF
jgi:outer membrane protein